MLLSDAASTKCPQNSEAIEMDTWRVMLDLHLFPVSPCSEAEACLPICLLPGAGPIKPALFAGNPVCVHARAEGERAAAGTTGTPIRGNPIRAGHACETEARNNWPLTPRCMQIRSCPAAAVSLPGNGLRFLAAGLPAVLRAGTLSAESALD